jgi:NAD(P)H dehydrogenase (quinone)
MAADESNGERSCTMPLYPIRFFSIVTAGLLAVYVSSLCSVSAISTSATPRDVAHNVALNDQSSTQPEISVLIVYYSLTGNTEEMAKSVAEGVRQVAGATALIKRAEEVATDDLKNADAMVLGSPTYFGDMAAPMKSFIDDWYLRHKVVLADKVGGAFSTGGGGTGGKEHVLYSFILAMMNAGMIPVGPLVQEFGTLGVSALDPVNETALEEAQALGKRVANVTQWLKAGATVN